ncbi:gp436 family protein [Ancylobacter lacus]|uniref:gp436 family protein n=1 Tax=Ancylobacter lacus TaxID=2579970 RepID=UPI001BCB8BEA|nr:DUF1320 domain-containing protein [Ancylobacter lacus]MBS7541493.1 DUF1320 domain-containing protein [Ancylobacter lacus]
MGYASLDDLVERAGEAEIRQVADRDRDGTPDPEVIAAALAAADQTVDGYLAVRFAMPLSTVPPLVRKWATSIARYQLHRSGAPDHVVRDYRDALGELRDAAAGRIALPGVDGLNPAGTASGGTLAEGSPPVFTRDRLEGFL